MRTEENVASETPETATRNYLQLFPTAALVAAARGEVDLARLVRDELANRGLDYFTGRWVGFERAEALAAQTSIAKNARGERIRVSIPTDA
jgi:hypothetical protein